MKRLLAFCGRVILSLAAMLFIAATSLFVVGAYLSTWPILRLSPRDRRVRSAIDLIVSIGALGQAFGDRVGRSLPPE